MLPGLSGCLRRFMGGTLGFANPVPTRAAQFRLLTTSAFLLAQNLEPAPSIVDGAAPLLRSTTSPLQTRDVALALIPTVNTNFGLDDPP